MHIVREPATAAAEGQPDAPAPTSLTSSCCGISCMMSFWGHWSVFLFRDTTASVKRRQRRKGAACRWLLTDSPLGSHGLDTAENASVWWRSPWKRPSASVRVK